eukprot:gnl/MRDRNA2_/MRDRNA2_60811_c0_seq1.p2 gnl/MRDRNA2_/MRDRNA2_60811_c0~~gnl/MRDRNA2_/MRDRNA2_60811_c0_seq1.p2  ORF type:complete len:116 (+),score=30.32 gnl/MRDRNA2_/MRDRNA2_60811_c0_seq1:119-466(+)
MGGIVSKKKEKVEEDDDNLSDDTEEEDKGSSDEEDFDRGEPIAHHIDEHGRDTRTFFDMIREEHDVRKIQRNRWVVSLGAKKYAPPPDRPNRTMKGSHVMLRDNWLPGGMHTHGW